MKETQKRKAYIGVIKSEDYDSRTLVMAKNEDDAKTKVLEKYKSDLGVYFQKSDVTIMPFAEGYK